MPCYHPIVGYRSKTVNPSGKRSIVFNPNDGYVDLQVQLPCGQCIGCRLEKSRQWAMRCLHESECHTENCFITLTFDDYHLDPLKSLRVADFQKFMKRLRKEFPHPIRYFHCGEYGEINERPHHHACLFGHQFDDLELHSMSNDLPLYTSLTLSKLWPYGFSTIGSMTFESAAYTARYCVKKLTGDKAKKHYGERLPPYNTMSRRPGIGAEWFRKFKTDVYPSDEVVVRKKITCKPPKFYDKIHEELDPLSSAMIKRKRLQKARAHSEDTTPERLEVRESLKLQQVNDLKRAI